MMPSSSACLARATETALCYSTHSQVPASTQTALCNFRPCKCLPRYRKCAHCPVRFHALQVPSSACTALPTETIPVPRLAPPPHSPRCFCLLVGRCGHVVVGVSVCTHPFHSSELQGMRSKIDAQIQPQCAAHARPCRVQEGASAGAHCAHHPDHGHHHCIPHSKRK